MSGIIYINSTLSSRLQMSADGEISAFHYWGYLPTKNDKTYSHNINRRDIIIRSRLKGLDIRIAFHVFRDLLAGYKALYLVTQPDLLVALPIIKRLFKNVKILTWVWTSEEVVRDYRFYKFSDYLFCLTEGAYIKLGEFGLASKASLQILETNASFYTSSEKQEAVYDVCLLGLVGRDYAVVEEVAAMCLFSVVTTHHAIRFVNSAQLCSFLTILSPETGKEVLEINKQSKVTWIPLLAREILPAGYTTLVESLLCGVPVVIADSSVLPEKILTLPGVFRYVAGSATSLIDKTQEAVDFGTSTNHQDFIQNAAANVFHSNHLSDNILKVLHEN